MSEERFARIDRLGRLIGRGERTITAGSTMVCPACGLGRLTVVDARAGATKHVIRRRRRCPKCDYRVTTFERIGESDRRFNHGLPVYDQRSVRREAIKLLMELAEQLDPDAVPGAPTVPPGR